MKGVLRKVLLALVVIVLISAIVPGWRYYKYFESHVSTDDAYVDGTVSLISSRIPGTIVTVYAEDNWRVKGGDLLLMLDSRDYQVRVDQAQAQLGRARQSIDQLFAQLDAAESGVRLASSQLHQAQLDYARARQLSAEGVVSRQFYDQAMTALHVATADRVLAEHQVQQARAALGGIADDHARYDRPIVQQAQAALAAARLDLSYSEIRAPIGGIITRKNVHPGNRVQPGEPLLAIVPVERLYVTANFKETQLTDVHVGQPAEIVADIYPGHVYQAHVDSISVGTGAAFALLPPENATGNWVKVVQRVPVKVVLNERPPPDRPLRIGLSVDVSIDVTDKRGPLLSSTLQHLYEERRSAPGGSDNAAERLQLPPDAIPPSSLPGQPALQQ
jgi:membrane fusion protein (multidrug efflux system)